MEALARERAEFEAQRASARPPELAPLATPAPLRQLHRGRRNWRNPAPPAAPAKRTRAAGKEGA
jgi:hypothetical protein